MDKAQIREAVEQLKVSCDLKMKDYEMISVRSGLYELGYSSEQADEVIKALADEGFSYCIDPIISTKDPHMPGVYTRPSSDVCYWGPDQLKSRLFCCHIR